jgi:D-alanyl-D-alanine carboxypeptidase/D-alanyl-D-alanine carboxypeptidase (penicillin-binding protein 5/6)
MLRFTRKESRLAIGSVKSGGLLSRFRGVLVATVLVGFGCFAGAAHAGYAAIVVDAASGRVLNEVNADEQNHPASLAKMMTIYITLQELKTGRLKIDQQLLVSTRAAAMAPTKLGLTPGRTISVRDCILGMVTKSANDAAAVAAEGIAGSKDRFVEMMNAQALLLGMTATHFDNASGLPSPHDTTTARDLAKLAMALYRDFPHDAAYFATRQFTFRGQVVRGHNRLMDRYPGMDGLKTGYTNAAGFNLASTAVRDGRRLFAVVMGGRTAVARDQLMARLLDDGFEHQQTPEVLVAQAGVVRSSKVGRALAALSPIKSATADTLPPQPRHRRHRGKRVAVARTTCQPRRGAACVRHKHAAHTPRTAAKLARRNLKQPTVVASRTHDGG